MKRLRKQTDGSYHLTDVQPHPTGLSTSGEIEVTTAVLTQEEVDAILKDVKAGTGPLPEPVSDTSRSEGLSNAVAPSTDLALLDENVDDVVVALSTLPEADLVALRQAEAKGKARKGVLAAIDTCLDALKG